MKLENHGEDHAGDQGSRKSWMKFNSKRYPIIRILEWFEYEIIEKNSTKIGNFAFDDGNKVQRCLPTVTAPTVEKHSLDQHLLQSQGWTNLPPMGSKFVEAEVGFFFVDYVSKYTPNSLAPSQALARHICIDIKIYTYLPYLSPLPTRSRVTSVEASTLERSISFAACPSWTGVGWNRGSHETLWKMDNKSNKAVLVVDVLWFLLFYVWFREGAIP